MGKSNKVLVILAACVVAAGCSVSEQRDPEGSGGEAPMPSRIVDIGKAESPPAPADVAQERACGAFNVVESLSRDAAAPLATPRGGANSARTDLVGLAGALNQLDRRALSRQMNAALTAHAVALTNLGALIRHDASRDDITSMVAVTDATGSTLAALCNL